MRAGQEWVRLTSSDVAAAREAAAASGLAHNHARGVFKEHLIDMVTGALERGAFEALELIDAEVAESTGMDLDAAAEADLRALGFDDAPAADPAEVFDVDAVRETLAGDAHVDSAVETLWPRLTPEVVVRALLADARTMARHLPSLAGDEHSRLVRSPDAPWTDADAPLLDEAAALVDGPPERTFGHVVVDEAQELTAMQWRMVMRRCPARSMTLVGDFAQAGPATAASDWSQALGPHLGNRFALHTLTVGYRTTQEILATTHGLLARIAPGQAPIRSIRHGETPRSLAACPHTRHHGGRGTPGAGRGTPGRPAGRDLRGRPGQGDGVRGCRPVGASRAGLRSPRPGVRRDRRRRPGRDRRGPPQWGA